MYTMKYNHIHTYSPSHPPISHQFTPFPTSFHLYVWFCLVLDNPGSSVPVPHIYMGVW